VVLTFILSMCNDTMQRGARHKRKRRSNSKKKHKIKTRTNRRVTIKKTNRLTRKIRHKNCSRNNHKWRRQQSPSNSLCCSLVRKAANVFAVAALRRFVDDPPPPLLLRRLRLPVSAASIVAGSSTNSRLTVPAHRSSRRTSRVPPTMASSSKPSGNGSNISTITRLRLLRPVLVVVPCTTHPGNLCTRTSPRIRRPMVLPMPNSSKKTPMPTISTTATKVSSSSLIHINTRTIRIPWQQQALLRVPFNSLPYPPPSCSSPGEEDQAMPSQ